MLHIYIYDISNLRVKRLTCDTLNLFFLLLFVQKAENFPYMDALELLVNKGRNIPVRLDLLPQLESQLSGAKTWKDRTARTFLRKNSHYTLMEVSEHVVCIMKLCLNISLIHSLLIM